MNFLDDVKKDLEKAGIDVGADPVPRYWLHTGNFVLNKIISGSFLKGIPQGRIVDFAGPSGSGKSFMIANCLREAQKEGAYLVVLDSENALDDDFVKAVGVDPTNNYTYVPVDTIPQAKKVVSSVVKGFNKEYGDSHAAPKLMIAIDSLDMLMTETEADHFEKGVTKGDQGQRNKQLKAMLREFVQAVKRPNISMVVTSQVYKNQDVMNGEGLWIVSDAVKYSLSQIVLLTKLKLRDKVDKQDVRGIRMKCEGYKTRFTKPYQTVTIEVPYDQGMDPYNGLLDVAKDLDVVTKKGAWYYFGDSKWQGKDTLPEEHANEVLLHCEAKREKFLEAGIDDSQLDISTGPSSKSRRAEKVKGDQPEG